MTIGKRIRALREDRKLSQPEFGEKLGVTRDVIANIELERVPPKKLMLKLIYNTFNVNPLWLENGEGEMYLETPESIIDDLAVEFNLSATEKNIVANYLKMSAEDRQKVSNLLHKLLGK